MSAATLERPQTYAGGNGRKPPAGALVAVGYGKERD